MSFQSWYENYKKNSYSWRAKHLLPILRLLTQAKITPNKITIFRLFFILPIAYFFYVSNLYGVLFFYLLFWLLDLIDGSLARYANIQSDKGRFIDSIVDNTMYGFAVVGFIYLQVASGWLLGLNILLEYVAQLVATIYKCKDKPSDWLIKVNPDMPYFKSFAHVVLLLFVLGYNVINPAFFLLNIWLAGTAGYHFYRIIKQ